MAARKRRNRFDFLTKKFPKRMQEKLVMVFMAVILAFVALIGNITYINASKGSGYSKIVLEQQQYDSRPIPYRRGDIVDRNGTKMAVSERVYNVILDVYVACSDEEYVEPTVKALGDFFGIPEETVRGVIAEHPDSRYEILAKGVDYETARAFEEKVEGAAGEEEDEAAGGQEAGDKEAGESGGDYSNVRGIWLEEDYNRNYPYDTLAGDVIGFVVGGNEGAIGIESAYNDILNGTNGREYGYFNEDASIERTVKRAKNGHTVVSTIDAALQRMVEQCILEFNEAHAGEVRAGELGSKNTAVIIMNPNTGEILAEASYPFFNLNNPRDLSILYTQEEWDAMTEEAQLEAMNNLWRNFCVSDTFEPGSTVKPLTVAAGLESGTVHGNETYQCYGMLHVGDYDIKCHLHEGHGTETVQDAVAFSCNVAMMHMAETIGVDNFLRYQHIFGFGEYTGIDLPGEASTEALLFQKDSMLDVHLATCSFGQGFNVTMTQVAAAFCSLVNGGYYYEPHVVKQIQDEAGRVVETRDPVLLRKTVSAETSAQIRPYLRAVMEYGTGSGIQVPGYDIGGKTGTAEKLPREAENYVLSYIGCAPLENPEVVVYVVIDQPNVGKQDDSQYVRELSQKIMSQAFPYLNITTVEGAAPAENTGNTEPAGDAETSQEDPVYTEGEYVPYDESYVDDYANVDGPYIDEGYNPDLDGWAEGAPVEY